MYRIALTCLFLLAATFAQADTFVIDYNIEDFGDSSGNVIADPIDFGMDVASIKSISVDLTHSWMSDIEMGLYAPTDDQSNATALGDVATNASYNLMADEDGSNDLGDGTELLAGLSTYTFVASGGGDIGGVGSPAPAGIYDANSWGGGGVGAGWLFVLTDDAAGDDGAIGRVTIEYNPVPEPTTGLIALLGGMGLFCLRRV